MDSHTAILEKFRQANQVLVDSYLSSARQTLIQLALAPDLLSAVRLERISGSYSRNLLFGDNKTSVWALVWAPGARTSIHDHHCTCCFTVLSGAIREVWFNAIDDVHVVKSAEHLRGVGYVAAMMPSGPNIHQMENAGSQDAVSIHIYGYDHRMHASSVHREYRRVEH